MTYKSLKKNLLIGICISASPRALSAFQPAGPAAPLHKIPFSSCSTTSTTTSTNAVSGSSSRRRPFAGAGFSQEQECSTFSGASRPTTLYYKNLDDYEEQQQQQESRPRSVTGQSFPPLPYPEEGQENVNEMSNTPFLVEENSEIRTAASSTSALPSMVDLPKSFLIKTNEAQNAKFQDLFLSTEMFIGRIAMIMAVYLLTEEVLTGSSVLDQLQQLSST